MLTTLRSRIERAVLPALLVAMAGVFGLFAISALAVAIWIGWSNVVSTGWTALLAMASYALIALLLAATARLAARPPPTRRVPTGEPLLSAAAGVVAKRPATSLALALVAGAALEALERRRRTR